MVCCNQGLLCIMCGTELRSNPSLSKIHLWWSINPPYGDISMFYGYGCTQDIEVNGKVVLCTLLCVYISTVYICVFVCVYINTDVAFHSTSSLLSSTYCESPAGGTVGGKRLKPNGQ